MHAQSVWALGTGTTNERAIYSRSECRAHGTSTLHSQTVAPAAAISLIALCDYMRQALIVIVSQSTTRRNVYGLQARTHLQYTSSVRNHPGRHATRPPPAGRRPLPETARLGTSKTASVEDGGQIDRVATPTSAGLHRFRWPRPRQRATDGVTVKTYYYYGHES